MDMRNSSAFTGVIEAETSKAYLFVFDFDYDNEWIPKSQSSFDQDGFDKHGQRRGTMMISKWLCEQNGYTEIEDLVDLIDKGDRG